MNTVKKNKWLIALAVILLLANGFTIAMFWLDRAKRPPKPDGDAKDYVVRELKLTAQQQEQYRTLIKEHRSQADAIRPKVREAKEALFALLKQPNVSDSAKQAAAHAVSVQTEMLDLVTLNHFQKIRALCTPEQQKRFDEIILDVVRMIGQPRPPMGPGGPGGPPGPPPGHEQGPPPAP